MGINRDPTPGYWQVSDSHSEKLLILLETLEGDVFGNMGQVVTEEEMMSLKHLVSLETVWSCIVTRRESPPCSRSHLTSPGLTWSTTTATPPPTWAGRYTLWTTSDRSPGPGLEQLHTVDRQLPAWSLGWSSLYLPGVTCSEKFIWVHPSLDT